MPLVFRSGKAIELFMNDSFEDELELVEAMNASELGTTELEELWLGDCCKNSDSVGQEREICYYTPRVSHDYSGRQNVCLNSLA